MSAIELRRNRRELGLSRFGLAWLAMAFLRAASPRPRDPRLAEGRYAGGLDLVATAIAFPAGVTWFLLRVEACRGGRGDRFIHGSPWWVLALPTAFAVYVTVVVMTIIDAGGIGAAGLPMALPNLVLVAIYAMVGFYVTRSTLRWDFAVDTYHLVVDWLSVPAGLYFPHVVRSLYRGSATDWNRMRAPRAGPPAPAEVVVPHAPRAARPTPKGGRLVTLGRSARGPEA